MNPNKPILAAPDACTGCTACASACPHSCIEMVADQQGFLIPRVSESRCVGCLKCQESCPIITPKEMPAQSTVAIAAYSRNESVRMASSSGGLFSELAAHVIRQGGIVWGARFDESFQVVHSSATDISELAAMRGAKYAQSDLSGAFPTIQKQLQQGKPVLFSGLPCQIAGLKSFLNGDDPNLFCIDCVCHSVPSPLAWEHYLQFRSRSEGEKSPVSVNFRSKETGWTKYRYSVQFTFPKSRYSSVSSEDIYMRLFTKGCISRESCGHCSFKGVDRHSDITLGDCWGIWDFASEFDDNRGTSLLLVHSEKGDSLFSAIKDRCEYREIDLKQACEHNPAILRSIKQHPQRDRILCKIIADTKFEDPAERQSNSFRKTIGKALRKVTNRLNR